MVPLFGKNVFVFDWDGTLFDSMPKKLRSFSSVVSQYFSELGTPIDQDVVDAIYRKFSGNSRSEIFLEVARANTIKLGQLEIEEMSARLFLLNKIALGGSKIFPDAIRLLNTLSGNDVRLFISSSVPQDELDYFVEMALPENLQQRFAGVFGSSETGSKGSDHLARISNYPGVKRDRMLVIGDDEADLLLSSASGVSCVLVDRVGRLFNRFPSQVIESLDELWNLLKISASSR